MNERIGPYEIQRELGRGGMGVVYLARDSRLDRLVAIKALPERLAQDPDRLARFEREARTLAQLNHPNVAGIYGVEEYEGARYLVLEFVEGQTLADRLDSGPLPLDEAVEIAVQIAAAIEAAHDAGVIHRDLKPANVIVTPDGQAKVLDFGLARIDEGGASSSGSGDEATLTSPAIHHSPTMPGVILGTAAYMSPEQARGRRIDKRTDIWSFGVVLYEMLTGASPFVGETVSDSISAILHKNVDLARLPPTTPRAVRHVLERCVVRDKSERFRDIGDVRIELERSLKEAEPDVGVAGSEGHRGARYALIALLLLVVGAGSWFAANWMRHATRRPVVKFDLVVESEGKKLRDAEPKISPNGSLLSYIQGSEIYVRELNSFQSRVIPGTKGAQDQFWSPDENWIGYHTTTGVYKVALSGGSPIKLNSEPLSLGGVTGGAWTKDGRIVFSDDNDGLMQISARGGAATQLLPLESEQDIDYHDPSVVAGTNVVLYIIHRRAQTFAVGATDGHRQVIVADMGESYLSHPAYSPSGHVLFSRGFGERSIWAIAFDLDELKASGEPFLVEPSAWQSSVSRNGDLSILRGAIDLGGNLAWMTREGEVESIEGDYEPLYNPILSPDGRRLAFSMGTPPKFDIWVRDLERGVNSRVTFLDGLVLVCGWSPDGRELMVAHFKPEGGSASKTHFYFADGSGESRPPIEGLVLSIDASWEHMVLVTDPTAETVPLYFAQLDAPEKKVPILSDFRAGSHSASLSPDGSLLAYESKESGSSQVFCTRLPGATGKWQISTNGGTFPMWSADGKRLYFLSSDDDPALLEVEVIQEPTLRFGKPTPVFARATPEIELELGWSPSVDGARFIVVQSDAKASNERASISIVQNWFEAFRSR